MVIFKYKYQLLLWIVLFFLPENILSQQTPMYSQYMFNMLNINPSYAGNRGVDNITVLHRMQWINISGAPVTSAISWDRRQKQSNVGFGFQVYNDQLGLENTTGIQGFYSYRLKFNNSFLSMGLSGGVMNYKAAFSQASTTEKGDPLFQEDVNSMLPTAGFGLLYASEKWYAGFSVPALLETKVSANKFGIVSASDHYFLTSGYIFNPSEIFTLKPSVMIKAVSGAPLQVDLNLNTWYQNTAGIGVSYRTKDAIVCMFELQLSSQLRLGYSYDYLVSNFKNFNSSGTHELMLRYEFIPKNTSKILSPRYY